MASCISPVDFVQGKSYLAGARCIMWQKRGEEKSKNSARYRQMHADQHVQPSGLHFAMVSFHTKLETQHSSFIHSRCIISVVCIVLSIVRLYRSCQQQYQNPVLYKVSSVSGQRIQGELKPSHLLYQTHHLSLSW